MSRLWRTEDERKVENSAVFCWTRNRKKLLVHLLPTIKLLPDHAQLTLTGWQNKKVKDCLSSPSKGSVGRVHKPVRRYLGWRERRLDGGWQECQSTNYHAFWVIFSWSEVKSRSRIKHCQWHNGPEGWVLITSSKTNLDQISSSESRPSINFKISTKHQPLHKT